MIGRVEEWMKDICQKHHCRYYSHRDYPYDSYCTSPDGDCIVLCKQDNANKSVDKKEEADGDSN